MERQGGKKKTNPKKCRTKLNFFHEDIQGLRRAARLELGMPGHGSSSTELCEEVAEAAVYRQTVMILAAADSTVWIYKECTDSYPQLVCCSFFFP